MKIVDLIPKFQFSWIPYTKRALKLTFFPFLIVVVFYFCLEVVYYYGFLAHPWIGNAIGALREYFGFGGVEITVTINQPIIFSASLDSLASAINPVTESSSVSIPLLALIKSLVPKRLEPEIGLFVIPLGLDVIRSVMKSWQSKVLVARKRSNSLWTQHRSG